MSLTASNFFPKKACYSFLKDCTFPISRSKLLHRWNFNCDLTLPSLRQTFGWKSLVVNLVLYLFFLVPLTALAVFTRANERRLFRLNESLTRKVSSVIVFQ